MKTHKLPLMIVGGILAVAILLVAIFGTVSAVRSSRAVYRYRGESVGVGEYAYFASVVKRSFLVEYASVPGASDTAFFFGQTDPESGKTYGELYLSMLDEYVRSLLVASYLYDTSVGMTRKDRRVVREAADAILYDRTGGDEDAFNDACAAYGFTYDDFCSAAELVYKSRRLRSVILGVNGEGIAAMEDVCDEFFRTQYSRVRLLFIRTESVFLYDEAGKRIPDEDTGMDSTRALTEAEREERNADIAILKEAYENYLTGKNGQMNEIMLSSYLEKYARDDSAERAESGYYFAKGEGFTSEISTVLPNIVNNALQMEMNSYKIVECTEGEFVGLCVLWRLPLSEGAYADATLSTMFSSFYDGAASYYYLTQIDKLLPLVEEGRRFGEIAPLEIPYNYYYTVSF